MCLEKRGYSVLIASAAENFNSALSALLPSANYSPVHIVSSISAAKRAFAERSYDYVIINAPLRTTKVPALPLTREIHQTLLFSS